MPFPEKGNSEAVEALINTLSIDGTALTEANLSGLISTSDLEQLAELSQGLNVSSDTDNQGGSVRKSQGEKNLPVTLGSTLEGQHLNLPVYYVSASEDDISTVHIEEPEDDELVQTELGAQEIEIETEHDHSPEEILPEAKPKTVPPLRPLTIAPKPAKVPITYKPVAGQQLFLVQGNASGQQIKLLSPQGLSLSNFSLGKPLAIKPTIKTISQPISTQPKQVIMKKVITQVSKPAQQKTAAFETKGHMVVVQKSEPQLKLVSQGNVAISTPTKTITLAQAQQMGLLTGAKLVPQMSTSKHAVVINKSQSKGIKLINQIRSPTKILPAPQVSTANKVTQRILLKPSTNSTLITPSQLIQVTGTQPITAGQIHQINIPGKGVQYIKFVTSQADSTVTSTANTTATAKISSQTLNLGSKIVTLAGNTNSDSGNIVLSEIKTLGKTSVIAPKPAKPAVTLQSTNLNSTSQLVMVPAGYLSRATAPKITIPVRPPPAKTPSNDAVVPINDSANLESNGMRPRKPCNCTKSQCLKLYCDCFANGEFCYMCNCMNCYNNLENEEHRQRAIKNCLERNPNAFRPKIGKAKDTGDTPIRKHTKGCNCKRSGCLKNYCECYEAKIACSSNCKCIGCRNIEDSMDKKNVRPQNVDVRSNQQATSKAPALNDNSLQLRSKRMAANKQAINYINTDVIEATTQCLLALANNAETIEQSEESTKQQLIEEFGRCLIEIIDCSINKTNHLRVT